MKRNRSWRRHQKQRVKDKAFHVLKDVWDYSNYMSDEEMKESAAKIADNLKLCSKSCCGNPRKHFNELTIQERRILLHDY